MALTAAETAAEVELPMQQNADMIRLCRQWKDQYPVVFELASTNLVKQWFPLFIRRGIMQPISGPLSLQKETLRNPSKVKGAIVDAFKPIMEQFPWTNPALTSKITQAIADVLQKEIERSIKEAEGERNLIQWATWQDVTNKMHVQSYIYEQVEHHDTFLMMNGNASVLRAKAATGGNDSLQMQLELQLKILTVDTVKMKQADESSTIKKALRNYDPFADELA